MDLHRRPMLAGLRYFFVNNDFRSTDLSLPILLAGFHSNQACHKSYKSWLFVLTKGQRQGRKDAQRAASRHHPLRSHRWCHGSLLWRAWAVATRPLVSQLLSLHSSPAHVKAWITSALAAGSRFISAMVSWIMRRVMLNHSLRVAERGKSSISRTGADETRSRMFGLGIGCVSERLAV